MILLCRGSSKCQSVIVSKCRKTLQASYEPIQINYHLAKFGGHRHCGSEDIMNLVFTLSSKTTRLKGRMTLWAGAHQGKLPSCQVFVAIGIVVVEI